MAFPDRIERTVSLTCAPRKVWQALTTADGLTAWFGERASIDLRPGGAATMTFAGGMTVDIRVEPRRGTHCVRVHLATAGPGRGRPPPYIRRLHPGTRRRRHPPARGRVVARLILAEHDIGPSEVG